MMIVYPLMSMCEYIIEETPINTYKKTLYVAFRRGLSIGLAVSIRL